MIDSSVAQCILLGGYEVGIIGGGAGQSGDPGYRHTHRDNNDDIKPKMELTKVFCSFLPFFLKVNISYMRKIREIEWVTCFVD